VCWPTAFLWGFVIVIHCLAARDVWPSGRLSPPLEFALEVEVDWEKDYSLTFRVGIGGSSGSEHSTSGSKE
jgi:hypothetical protein